jgi:hypothetical protein
MSYLKAEMVMLFVMYCECLWPVCTGCWGFGLRCPAERRCDKQCIVVVDYTQNKQCVISGLRSAIEENCALLWVIITQVVVICY